MSIDRSLFSRVFMTVKVKGLRKCRFQIHCFVKSLFDLIIVSVRSVIFERHSHGLCDSNANLAATLMRDLTEARHYILLVARVHAYPVFDLDSAEYLLVASCPRPVTLVVDVNLATTEYKLLGGQRASRYAINVVI